MVKIPLSGDLSIELSDEDIRRYVVELKRAETIRFYHEILFIVDVLSLEWAKDKKDKFSRDSFEDHLSEFYFDGFARDIPSIDYSKLEYPAQIGIYAVLNEPKTLLEIFRHPASFPKDSISSFNSNIGNCLVIEWMDKKMPRRVISDSDVNSATIGTYKKDENSLYVLEERLK